MSKYLLFFVAMPLCFVCAWQSYPYPFCTVGFVVIGLLIGAVAVDCRRQDLAMKRRAEFLSRLYDRRS